MTDPHDHDEAQRAWVLRDTDHDEAQRAWVLRDTDHDEAQRAWVLRDTDHDDRAAFMDGWDAAMAAPCPCGHARDSHVAICVEHALDGECPPSATDVLDLPPTIAEAYEQGMLAERARRAALVAAAREVVDSVYIGITTYTATDDPYGVVTGNLAGVLQTTVSVEAINALRAALAATPAPYTTPKTTSQVISEVGGGSHSKAVTPVPPDTKPCKMHGIADHLYDCDTVTWRPAGPPYTATPAPLDEPWAAVHAALPAGNRDIGFTVRFNPRARQYEAWSWHWDSPPGDVWPEHAATPDDVLYALAAVLRVNLAEESDRPRPCAKHEADGWRGPVAGCGPCALSGEK